MVIQKIFKINFVLQKKSLDLCNENKKTMKKILILIVLAVLASCAPQKHIVYMGRGLVVTGVLLGDNPEQGKFIYFTQDLAGEVIIWSDQHYHIGDTIRMKEVEYISKFSGI